MKNIAANDAEKTAKHCLGLLAEVKGDEEAFVAFIALYALCFLRFKLGAASPMGEDQSITEHDNGGKELDARLNTAMKALETRGLFEAEEARRFIDFESRSWGPREAWLTMLTEVLYQLDQPQWYVGDRPLLLDHAFEYIADKTQESGGAYTPSEICRLLVELTAPKPGECIYDPACGSGGFLVAAERYIGAKTKQQDAVLEGRERVFSTAVIAKLRVFLNSCRHENILFADSLFLPEAELAKLTGKCDVVVANPPFSLKSWQKGVDASELSARFKFGVPPDSNADFAFISHALSCLKEGGRAALIVPDGVLFRGGREKQIRKNIVEHGHVKAVIALPPRLFLGTSIPTNILVLTEGRNEDILFINFRDGGSLSAGRTRVVLSEEELKRIVEIFRCQSEVENISNLSSIEEISANHFDLRHSMYIDKKSDSVQEDRKDLWEKQRQLRAELNDLQGEMDKIIADWV